MEDRVDAKTPEDHAAKYCDMYEAAAEASDPAREKANRDRDYYDNKQFTPEEMDTLRRRGQPPISLNVIRARVDFMQGLEKKQRRDPKCWPRNNPDDVEAADAFTEALRYVVESADYATSRSAAWQNIVIEGAGGVELSAVEKPNGDYELKINRVPWDRFFCDPHSSEPDFSDAGYLGQVVWRDLPDALLEYGEEARDTLMASINEAPKLDVHRDRPEWTAWGDKRRQRVRICLMWHKEGGRWRYCEFTKGGVLVQQDGPYIDEEGEAWCPLIMESAYVDRENNRSGVVRDLIDPQDEINKRRSKALHLLTMQGVIASAGAVEDVGKTRAELARPDFYIEKVQGSDFEIVRNTDLAVGQAQLAEQAMAYVAQSGPNEALLGKGTTDQSGRAIEAQQAGGLIEQGSILDGLRRMDLRVFRGLALMIKQFKTAEWWVRVTDDELAPKWVGLNVTQPDDYGQPQVLNNVAELEMDVIVSDAPMTLSLDGENYQAFTQMLASGLPPPMLKLAVEMHPSLTAKRKKQVIDMLDQMAQQPPPQPDPMQVATAEADIKVKQSQAFKNLADGHSKMQAPPPMRLPNDRQPAPAFG